jgi:hypothetical protein
MGYFIEREALARILNQARHCSFGFKIGQLDILMRIEFRPMLDRIHQQLPERQSYRILFGLG